MSMYVGPGRGVPHSFMTPPFAMGLSERLRRFKIDLLNSVSAYPVLRMLKERDQRERAASIIEQAKRLRDAHK